MPAGVIAGTGKFQFDAKMVACPIRLTVHVLICVLSVMVMRALKIAILALTADHSCRRLGVFLSPGMCVECASTQDQECCGPTTCNDTLELAVCAARSDA